MLQKTYQEYLTLYFLQEAFQAIPSIRIEEEYFCPIYKKYRRQTVWRRSSAEDHFLKSKYYLVSKVLKIYHGSLKEFEELIISRRMRGYIFSEWRRYKDPNYWRKRYPRKEEFRVQVKFKQKKNAKIKKKTKILVNKERRKRKNYRQRYNKISKEDRKLGARAHRQWQREQLNRGNFDNFHNKSYDNKTTDFSDWW